MAGRDNGIPLNNRAEPPVLIFSLIILHNHFRAQGKGTNIRKDNFLHFLSALLHGSLNRRPQCHGLIRIHPGIRKLPKQTDQEIPHNGQPGGPADEQHLVDLRKLQPCIRQTLLHRIPNLHQKLLTGFLIFLISNLLLQSLFLV